ncbi:TetR/AcrR family transcriptional regulator [Halostreptopolyspora alba]|uniref:TetR/AcrR family transcriptional regulator n=1 Tax=Halostreptopolyspora alba TaxID=2487137 RepID=A0A3N0E2A8_9ACTN|nr:TetR/AcrR family transcriptional regulator [Nocardiopsaceae bacterium YIM 96095]
MPAPITEEQNAADRETLLDTAEELFYERGIRAVGMDEVRTASGLPLKRIYRLFATKEDLVVAMLQRRDTRWRTSLAAWVEQVEDPRERVLAIFDWLAEWFAEPGFRGCAWINAHGELGTASEAVLAEVHSHKRAFHEQVAAWVHATEVPVVEPVLLLAEGAIVTAGISGDPASAHHARTTVATLLDVPQQPGHTPTSTPTRTT